MLEKLRSKIIVKIGLLIIIETIFIFSNFGILAYFQSEGSSLGNSINIAGKNRYLTASLLLQAEKYLDSSSNIPQVKAAMDKLELNIQTLKQGGKISDIELKPLPSEFSGSWDIINKKWQSFKMFINDDIINFPSPKQSSLTTITTTTTTAGQSSSSIKKTQLESMAAGLIDSSDILVTKLGLKAGQNSQNLMLLGLVLGIINIGILVLILYLVIKILRPIFALTAATSKVKKGNLDVSVKLPKGSNDELSILSESFNSMLSSIRDYIKYQNELKNEIQKANVELKNKNQLLDEFVNIAAHELRTPIQPIIGLTEVVYSKTKDTEQRKLLDAIVRNAKRLQQLTEDILDVARIESQTLKLNKERININEKVRNVVNDIIIKSKKEEEDKIEITIVKPQIDPIIIQADKTRIYEVISNLLTNAIKFTKKKKAINSSSSISGGRGANDANNIITISTTTVKSNQHDENKDNNKNEVIISIKDMGTGIDSDIQDRLFTKFATKSDTRGTGLGLFISKNIIEAHGGKIWAENNADGRGATFSFTLPIEAR